MLAGKARKNLLNQMKRQLAERGELYSFRSDDSEFSELKDLYLELNEEFFEGILPDDLPVLFSATLNKGRRKTRCYGKAYYVSNGISKKGHRKNCKPQKIEIALGMTNRMTRKVLVHEMCHIFCYQEFGEVGHGKQFWLKMRKCGYPNGHRFPDQQPGECDKWSL